MEIVYKKLTEEELETFIDIVRLKNIIWVK